MANPQQLSLEVLIKTIADNAGLKSSSADVKKLAVELEGAATGGKALDITTASVAARLKEISAASTPAAIETVKVAAASKQVTEAVITEEEKLQTLIKALKDTGLSSSAVEAELAALKQTQASGVVENFRAELREQIELTKSAGGDASDLETKLRNLSRAQFATATATKTATQAATAAAPAAGQLGTQLGKLKEAGTGANQVLNGLSQGGIGGLIQTGRGALTVLRSVGTVLAGPIGLGLGAAAAGIAYLGKQARENQTAIEKIFIEAGKGAADLKTKYAELETSAAKSLEAQIADVNKLAAAYQRVLDLMNTAEQRNAAVVDATEKLSLAKIDRDEQAALGKAKTPEEKEKIAKTSEAARIKTRDAAAKLRLENERFNTETRTANAKEEISNQQSLIDEARLTAREKHHAAEDARSISEQAVRENPDSRRARETLANAKAAAKEAELAEQNFGKVDSEARKAIDVAVKQIAAAEDTKKLLQIQEKALTLQQESVKLQRANAEKPALSDTSTAEGTVRSAAEEKAKLEEQLRSRQGLPTDPKNADLVQKISAQTAVLERGTAELVAVQSANASAMEKYQKAQLQVAYENQRKQQLAERQSKNKRSTVY